MKSKIFLFSFIVILVLSLLSLNVLNCPTSSYLKAQSDISALGHSVNVFFDENGGLPVQLADLLNEKHKITNRLPKDPWDIKYQYNILNKDTFIIWSIGSFKNGDFTVSSIFSKNDKGEFISKIMHGESSI